MKPRDLRRRQAKHLLQHLGRMLAQQRRMAGLGQARGGKAQGGAHHFDMAELGMRDLGHHLAGEIGLLAEGLRDLAHLAARDIRRGKALQPMGRRLLQEQDSELGHQRRAVLAPLAVGGVFGRSRQIGTRQDLHAETLELVIGAHRQRQHAVGRGEGLIGHDGGMGIAEAHRLHLGIEIAAADIGQELEAAAVEGDIDALPLPGHGAVIERGQDCLGRIHAGDEIGDGDAEAQRLTLGGAGDGHQPAFGLHDEIIARPVGQRPVAAIAGDRAMDDPRVERPQGFIIEAEALQGFGHEILDDDIGAAHQLAHQLGPARARHVEGDRLLVAIDREVIGGDAAHAGRRPFPGLIAALGRLHLPDLGAQIGQGHGAPWPRQHPGEIEDLDAFQGGAHAPSPRVQCRRLNFAWRNAIPQALTRGSAGSHHSPASCRA